MQALTMFICPERRLLLQFGVLGLGRDENGDVGVGVFPEGKEILIGRFGFGGIALYGVRACKLEPGQRAPWKVHHNSPMVDEFLKFFFR